MDLDCPPFFIIGTPRSGTTLLQCILATHSKIAMAPETHLFSHALPAARAYVNGQRITDVKRFLAS